MSECCGGTCDEKRDFWGWWKEKEITFTSDQVKDLLVRGKKFRAGNIDRSLTNNVEDVVVKGVVGGVSGADNLNSIACSAGCFYGVLCYFAAVALCYIEARACSS